MDRLGVLNHLIMNCLNGSLCAHAMVILLVENNDFFLCDNLPKWRYFFLEGIFGNIFSLFQWMKSLDCYQFQGGIPLF
jgi:hypothetical protein